MLTSRRPPSFFTQFWDLLLIELTNWRWSWRTMVIVSFLFPLGSMMALSVFARDSGVETLGYVLTGNLVLSIMFGNQNNVQSHVGYIRFQGMLDYFASLPVRKQTLVLAILCAFLLLSLPSLVATILFGAWLLDIPIRLSPLIMLVVPLSALPMAGLGALIGAIARTPEEGGAISLVVSLVMLGIGPVVAPPERLPAVLLTLGKFSPATYAASALRQVLLGPVTGQILWDFVALSGFTCLAFWLIGRKMDWRNQ